MAEATVQTTLRVKQDIYERMERLVRHLKALRPHASINEWANEALREKVERDEQRGG